MIILIRHAQSEGNKNREIHQSIPDHRVKLTPEGQKQALEAGRKLRTLLRPDDTLHFFTSPYRRTRETTEGILTSLTSDNPSPSPFPRYTINVYEEPRLREQDFGNFQPCSAAMEHIWKERADYGHFFYRIPNGESAADAYDRVSGFNETLWRLFGEDDFASVCILVTHGLMTRVFLMKWYHFSVEYFEDLRNVNHCEFVIMKQNQDNGKFILQNQLRTWSELKRETAARGNISQPQATSTTSKPGDSPISERRKWGGCPDGCDHDLHKHGSQQQKRPPVRQNTADLFRDDDISTILKQKPTPTRQSTTRRISATSSPIIDRYPPQDDSSEGDDAADPIDASAAAPPPRGRPNKPAKPAQLAFRPMSPSDPISSPDGTSSYISKSPDANSNQQPRMLSPRGLAILQFGGRDGGGSRSGATSQVGSDEDDIEGQPDARSEPGMRAASKGMTPPKPRSLARALHGEFGSAIKAVGGVVEGRAMADALGDQSDASADGEDEDDTRVKQEEEEVRLVEDERRDRSLRGSVY